MLVEVLIPITFFAAIFGILYVYFTTRNKERLAMIEKGADPSIFASPKRKLGRKIGLLAIGGAIGLLVGQSLVVYGGVQEEIAIISMVLLFAGSSLVIEHFLEKKDSDSNS